MKVLVGLFSTESNAHVPTKNDLSAYKLSFGETLLDNIRCRRVFESEGIELIPSIGAGSGPSGVVERAAFDYIEGHMLETLSKHLHEVDGIYLMLHGASYVEGLGSGDHHIIHEIRKMVGPYLPIAVTCDPHGNLTGDYVNDCTIIRSYRQSPHTDIAETCITVAQMLCDLLKRRRDIHGVYRKLPLLLGGEQSVSTDEPVASINAFMDELEQDARIWSCSWHVGYIRHDTSAAGAGIVVVPYDKESLSYAEEAADRLASFIWERRHEFHYTGLTASPEEALSLALAQREVPCVITDWRSQAVIAPRPSGGCGSMTYGREVRNRVLNLVRGGVPAETAAREAGVSDVTARVWCSDAGITLKRGRPRKGGSAMPDIIAAVRPGRAPGARMGPWERISIQEGIRAGRSLRSISEGIGFSHSSVSREIARGSVGGVYDARRAQERAEAAAARPKARKLAEGTELRGYVAGKLDSGWSPRQISGRLVADFPDNGAMRISHETIYQALYVQGKGALREELSCEQALRSGRTSRGPRSKLPARPGRGWAEGCEISGRPPEAEDRAVPGHWEGDLVIGGDLRSCLVTLVERKTRYLEMRALPAHDTRTVVDLLIEMVADVPESVRSSVLSTLTWDQGCELADHARFTEATGFKVYFCDPHSPWQKGTNENTNGLIRQYFPKGTEFADVEPERVRQVQGLLNSRPRETLGWKTPAEALAKVLSEASKAVQ